MVYCIECMSKMAAVFLRINVMVISLLQRQFLSVSLIYFLHNLYIYILCNTIIHIKHTFERYCIKNVSFYWYFCIYLGVGVALLSLCSIFFNKCLLCFVICTVQTWGSINYTVFVVVPTITKPQKGFQCSAVVNTKICCRWHMTQIDETFLLHIYVFIVSLVLF